MALNNYIYTNTGTVYQPISDAPQLGTQQLLYNVSGAATSAAFPYFNSDALFNNIFITADTWGGASVSIEVSIDGVKNWTPLFESVNSTPITNISTNLYAPIILRNVFIRAVATAGGTNVSAIIC